MVEPSDASVSVFSSTVNDVDDTIDLTVNVLLLFDVPVTVTRSRTANFPLPVNVGDWLALIGGLLCAIGAIKLEEAKYEEITSLLFSFFFYGLLVTLVTSLLFSDAFGPFPNFYSWINMFPLLLILSIIFFIPSNIIILWSPSKIGAGLFSILVLSEIIFGTISAALISNEQFGWREGIGGLLMLIAGFSEIFLSKKNGVI